MNLHNKLQAALNETFTVLGYDTKHARLSRSQRDGFDFQCNGAMALGKILGEPSNQLAETIAVTLRAHDWIDKAVVSGNGFINLVASNQLLEQALAGDIPSTEDDYNVIPQRILLDFGGPNIAKPLHVGHLRSLVIGESLSRILSTVGHEVTTDIHYGDWGLQMGQLLSYIFRHVDRAEYTLSGFTMSDIESWYTLAVQECKDDPTLMEEARSYTANLQMGDYLCLLIWRELKRISLDDQRPIISALGAHFDLWLGESDVNEYINPLCVRALAEGVAQYSEGALVIPVSEPTDRTELPPLILRKSDGAALYGTTDLATIGQRDYDHIIYVVDQRQEVHFKQVFRAAKKLGFTQQLTHVGFGTVNGADGKPFKTRSGETVRLTILLDEARSVARAKLSKDIVSDKLVNEIAMAAIKFGDLQTNRLSGYNFDLDKFVELEGKTGPYLQYAVVRIHSILRKLGEVPFSEIKLTTKEEHDLAVACFGFHSAMLAAAADYALNRLAEYAFDLAQVFNRFYTNCPVLGVDANTQYTRLCLLEATSTTLQNALFCLGIEVPIQM